MKKYRKISEVMRDNLSGMQNELVKELLYSVWLMATYYPNDKNCVVLLLNDEQELKDVKNIFQLLNSIEPESKDITWCDNNIGFCKMVWVTGQDGGGIIVLFEVRYGL